MKGRAEVCSSLKVETVAVVSSSVGCVFVWGLFWRGKVEVKDILTVGQGWPVRGVKGRGKARS